MVTLWPMDRENSAPRSAYTSVGVLAQAAREVRIVIIDNQREYLNMIGLIE
jgi:hypothetical protein